jgi:hypothetical protein
MSSKLLLLADGQIGNAPSRSQPSFSAESLQIFVELVIHGFQSFLERGFGQATPSAVSRRSRPKGRLVGHASYHAEYAIAVNPRSRPELPLQCPALQLELR